MIIAIWESAPGENCRGKATNGISTYRLLGLYGYLTWYGLSQQPMGKGRGFVEDLAVLIWESESMSIFPKHFNKSKRT